MRFFTPDEEQPGLGLRCLGVGVQRGEVPVIRPRRVARHVAVVVTAGEGWFRGPRRQEAVVAPCLLWLVPGVVHSYGPDASGWEEKFVAFDGSAVETYTRHGYITPGRPVVPLRETADVEVAVTRLTHAVRPGNPLEQVESAVALHDLLRELRRAAAQDAAMETARPVMETLARNAFLDLTVEEHASRIGISAAELRSVVRASGGRSPKNVVMTVRLNRAQELLATTDLPVATVGRMVGFVDPAYFSRAFTRRVGMAPTRFREQYLPGTV